MALYLFDRMKAHIQLFGNLLSQVIQGTSLQARGPTHPQSVPYDHKGKP
jgi:hypothetical protein